MPEADTTPQQEPTPPAPEATSSDLGDAGKAAIQKERDARKDLERRLAEAEEIKNSLAVKVQEFEDRDKSETQKLSDQLTALQKQLADKDAEIAKATLASLKATVAADKGVLASALTGSTKEELEASADELIAWRDAAKPTRKPPTATGLKSGASGSGDSAANPMERAAAAMRELRRSGA